MANQLKGSNALDSLVVARSGVSDRKGFVVLMKLLAVTITALALTATAQATTWHVVKSKTARGDFAVTAISASINNRPIAVKIMGHETNATVVWACSKGFSVSSWSKEYKGNGLHVLPHTSGSCNVTLSGGGSGYVTVQILKG